MRYDEFRNKIKEYAFFRSNTFEHITDNSNLLRRQMVDWAKRGYIIKLKKSFYTLNDNDRKARFSLFFLANNLYLPSYISLESALSYYRMIPEKIAAVTSISSKKTQRFTNAYGNFIYHHISPKLYGDFVAEQDEFGNKFYLATPERAVVDFLYFKGIGGIKADIFEDSFRWQNTEKLNLKQLRIMGEKFNSPRLAQLIDLLIKKIRCNNARSIKNQTDKIH